MSMYSDIRDSGAGGWLVVAVKNHPEGLLLLAAGCALLMRSSGASKSRRSPDARRYGRNDMPQSGREARGRTVGERLSETAQSAGEYVSDIGESVAETASSYASSVSSYADGVAERSGRLARQAQSSVRDTISRVVQEQPLTVALVGVAAGAAVAAAFPTTDLESQTLGATGERLRDAAGRAGEQLKDAATKAGQRLAAAADERGLNTEGFKEVARDVGEAFSSALEGEEANKKAQSKSQTSKISPSSTNQHDSSKKGGPN
jgi:hypothetical protein